MQGVNEMQSGVSRKAPRPARMPSWPTFAIALSGTVLAFAAPSGAQDDAASALEDRLDSLERDNAHLRAEVDALRAETNQEWLTEQRATEIRGIVTDVLADSATRTSLQNAGATAGWNSQLGFYLKSADNRFSLQVGGLVQARYIFSNTSDGGFRNQENLGNGAINGNAQQYPSSQYGFDMPHTRLVFKGHVFEPGIRYYLRTQFAPVDTFTPGTSYINPVSAGALDVLDAYVTFDLDNQWSLRVGQFKLPFSRERLVSVQNLLTATTSFVDDIQGVGRSQGVELSTRGDDLHWSVAISDGGTDNLLAGISNNSGYFPIGTAPVNSPYWDSQAEFSITSRVEYKLAGTWDEFSEMTSPMGEAEGLMLGLAGHFQTGSRPTTDSIPGGNPPATGLYSSSGNNEWMNVTADVTWNLGGASLFGAIYYSNADTKWSRLQVGPANPKPTVFGTTRLLGLVVQGSVYLTEKWEVYGRYQFLDPLSAPETEPPGPNAVLATFSSLNAINLGANWYIDGQDVRWTFEMGYAFNQVRSTNATVGNGFRPTDSGYEFVLLTQLQLQF